MRARASTSPRKLPRQQRSKATVEALLAATAQVLVREGYEHANTNRIAEVSGYGIGSLYEYFPNKESLVATLIGRAADDLLALFEEWFRAHADSSLPVAVRAFVEAALKAHPVDPELHKVLVEVAPKVGDLNRLRQVEDRITDLVRAYLEPHLVEIAPEDPGLAAFIVMRTVEALCHEAVVSKPEYLQGGRFVEEVTALVLRYLTPSA
jgi:AcrR family transcriptional regulator